MRNFIFNFDQNVMVELGLSTEQGLLLDYLVNFFDSGNAVTQYVGGKKFCWITYKKMLEDLPILRKKERQTRRILVDLENKNLIKRYLENKNKLYIYVNQELLFYGYDGSEGLTNEDVKDINDLPAGQDVPPIVKYYKNKIKILTKNAHVKDFNKCEFIRKLKDEIKPLISNMAFEICFKNADVELLSNNMILLNISTTSLLKNRPNLPFENAVSKVISNMTVDVDSQGDQNL